jgi:RHS repeat-associated protein
MIDQKGQDITFARRRLPGRVPVRSSAIVRFFLCSTIRRMTIRRMTILLAALLSVCLCVTELRAQTVLIGDQTIESNLDSNATGLAEAFPATASASGPVGSVNLFLDESSVATKIYVGIYQDASGKPGSLLTQGSTTQFAPGTWNSVAVSAANLTSGVAYWIAILGTGGKPYFRDRSTTACHSQTSSQSNLTSLTSTWSTGQTWNTCYISAYAVSGTLPATVMVGNQALESNLDKNPAGRAEAFPAIANTTGSLGTIALYLDSTSGSGPVDVGLYEDNSGHPGTLIAQGTTVSPVAGSWNQISITPSNITAGLRYWIAVLGTQATSPYFRDRQTSACHSEASSLSTLTSLPASWSTGTIWNTCYISAYGLLASGSPALSISPSSLSFAAVQGGTNPAPANLNVTNTGTGILSFTDSTDASWLSATPPSGTAPQTIQVSAAVGSLTAGTYTGHVTVTGTGAQNSPAVATVTFTVGAFVPPSITASFSPSANANGWNNSNVTVSFTCAPGSYSVQTCTAPVLVSTEGANQAITGTVTDTAGNSNTAKIALNIGKTPPKIVAQVSPTPNTSNWNNSNVTIGYTCTAGTAPVASCPPSQTVTTAGANQQFTGTVTDLAGLTATAPMTLNIDLTPPVLSIASPANGDTLTSLTATVSGSVSDTLSGVASVTCNGAAATVQTGSYSCVVALALGADTISVQATDVAGTTTSQSLNITYFSGPTITGFSPPSAAEGTLITLTGTNFSFNGLNPEVTLSQQGGGTIIAPISSFSAGTASFVIPSGAATGPIMITVDGQSATSSSALNVVSSSTFTVTAGPSAVTLLPGQSATVQVSLASTNGLTQLAALNVAGLPSGVSASLQPPQITAGQFSILTLSAPASQTPSASSLAVTATATVQGVPLTQTAAVSLSVQALSGSATFAGRVAVTNAYDTPLVGVTVSFTGKNYTGTQTGCTGSTTTDSAGNFVLNGLSNSCTGSQMITYDPSTVISPPGKYSGVTLSYVLTPGQVTTPGIVVHLPNVTNAESFTIPQNSSTDQTFISQSIPGVIITIYAGTTFSLADGTQPDPFPLAVVEIPYDKIPDYMPPNPTEDPVFAMSVEPFNSSSSQPIAVSFPNRRNTPPGTTMPLTSLNPTLGMMVNYGTGTVSGDGTQVIPDLDPANPGHLYGVSHFDWYFPSFVPATNAANPSPDPNAPKRGDPVDTATGLLVVTKTDIAFGGSRSQVALTRNYRALSSNSGPFGFGTNHNYGYLLDVSNGPTGLINLVMPDGNQFPFSQQPDGTFINSTVPSMQGAVINGVSCYHPIPNVTLCSAYLRWKNGTTFSFQPTETVSGTSFLTSIADSNGNGIGLARSTSLPLEITQITDSNQRTLNFTYDSAGRITSVVDSLGQTVLYTYNSLGRLATVSDAAGGVTTYNYDDQSNLISVTDPRQITYLQNTFDANGRVIKQVAADGGVTSLSYTQLNSGVPNSPVVLTTVTDPRGNTTLYHFNPSGFLVDMTDALGQKTVYTLNPSTNQTVSVTDPLMRTTSFTYDSAGNTTSITRLAGTPGAVTTNFTYDPTFNKVTSITDPLGHTTSFKYDNAGNPANVTDPMGNQSTFQHDPMGEMIVSKDPMGNSTQFTYSNGHLTQITDPLGRTTIRSADTLDRTRTMTNPQGQSVQYQYSALNQITQVTDPAGNNTTFSYDSNGNLLNVTDANSHTTSYTYESMDRLVRRIDPLGHTESYQYDQNGNMTQFTDRRGVATNYGYDALSRRVQTSFGGQSSINYGYDAGNRLLQAVDSITGTVARSYDGLDRLISEVTPEGTVAYGYDVAGRRTGMSVSGQSAVSYSYDNANRLMQIAQGASGVRFNYDSDSRRTSVTLPNGVVMSYGYDAASQLSAINYQLGNTTLGNLTYSYDLGGRRTNVGGSFARTNLPLALTNATYNGSNELTQFGSSSLTFDANGNMTSDNASSYTWDARNHLVSITGAVSASFQYDPFGRRVAKTTIGTTQYLYDRENPVEELSNGTPRANLLTGLSVDEYFQRTDVAGPASFLTDALGGTLSLTGGSGNTLAQYTYEPFGNTTVSGSSANSYEYTARENDGSALYFYRSRYYSPSLQRFLSEDPIGTAGGMNLYAYVGNDPILLTDATGRCPMCVAGIIGGIIGGTVGGYQAYVNGASGWNVVAAAAGGAGTGILAGLTGGLVGGSALAAGASEIAAGAWGGAAAGATSGVASGAVGIATGTQSAGEALVNAAEGAAFGAGTGAAGVYLGGTVQGGSNFNPWTSPATWGPRGQQLYWQTIISGELDSLICLSGRKC